MCLKEKMGLPSLHSSTLQEKKGTEKKNRTQGVCNLNFMPNFCYKFCKMLMQVGIDIRYIYTYLHHQPLLRLGHSCLGPHKTEAEVFAH